MHAIEESYGTTDSTTSPKKEFYRRDQQETESFEEYSLALVRIADRIAQRDNHDEDSLATELKEHLTEEVSDRHFQRELRRLSLDEPELTFWSLRARATKWLGDDTTKNGKQVTTVNEVGQTTASLKDKLEKQCSGTAGRNREETVGLWSAVSAEEEQLLEHTARCTPMLQLWLT